MSMDTDTGVAVNTSLDVVGNLTVGGVFDCATIASGDISTSTLKLGAPTEMTYTTMTASTSTQVGYIISAKSTLTTVLSSSLSAYICYFNYQ